MARVGWTYDAGTNRYRDGASGRFTSKSAVVKIRDDIVEVASKQANGFASKVANGEMSPGQFGSEMRKLIKTVESAQYSLGRGGIQAMTPSDYGSLGQSVKAQFKALDGFVRAIEAKDMTPEQIANRANLYFDQSIRSHELGKAAAMGVKAPDVTPPLHGHCRCSLAYSTEGDQQVVRWMTASDPCEACQAMAGEYNPLILEVAA